MAGLHCSASKVRITLFCLVGPDYSPPARNNFSLLFRCLRLNNNNQNEQIEYLAKNLAVFCVHCVHFLIHMIKFFQTLQESRWPPFRPWKTDRTRKCGRRWRTFLWDAGTRDTASRLAATTVRGWAHGARWYLRLVTSGREMGHSTFQD